MRHPLSYRIQRSNAQSVSLQLDISIFFGFFFAYGVYLPFWALWFEEQGVSTTDIGLLVGIGFATRCVANMVLTPRIHELST